MKTRRIMDLLAAGLVWVLCTAALTGCGRLAGPIALPRAADIVRVELCSGEARYVTADRGWIVRALRALGRATPTRRASIQDCPQAQELLEVHFHFAQGVSTLFLYRENGGCFVEQPYQGIWRIEEDVYALFGGAAWRAEHGPFAAASCRPDGALRTRGRTAGSRRPADTRCRPTAGRPAPPAAP